MRGTLTALTALFVQVAQPPAPEFAKYPAESRLTGAPAKPQFATPEARRFRTVLRTAAAQGPDFNGHYRIAYWGCGTNCIQWAVINLRTGTVWMAPDEVSSCWAVDATQPETHDWIEAYVESRLLYLYDCNTPRTDRVFDRRRIFVWTNGAPRLLRTEHLYE